MSPPQTAQNGAGSSLPSPAKGSTASATTSKTSGAYPASHSNASVSCLVVSWPIRSTRSSAVIRCAAGAAWVRLSPMVDSSTVDGRG
jgi:hypothetical protein